MSKRSKWGVRVIMLASVLAAAGCSDSTGTSGVNGPSSPTEGLLTATVDGSVFSAVPSSITATNVNGVIRISGVDGSTTGSGRTLDLTIVGNAPGIYPIGPPSGTPATSASLTLGGARWVADATLGSGSITITAFMPTQATGTFLFSAEPVPGTSAVGARIVTQGTFTVTF
jgi:hypothetical protein